jgi:hypothetical protein
VDRDAAGTHTGNEMKAGRDPLGRANDPNRASRGNLGDQGGAANPNRNKDDDL